MTLSTTSPGDERLPHADSVQQPSDESIRNAITALWNAQCFTIDEMSAFESALRFGTRPAAEPGLACDGCRQWVAANSPGGWIDDLRRKAAEPSQSGSAGEAEEYAAFKDWRWKASSVDPWDAWKARAALSRQAPAAVDFEQWWLAEVAANGGVPIGADYKHWAKKGFELRGDARAPAAPAEPAKTEAMITYAHKADASRSTRFRAFATDALPVWAVDIRPEPAKTEASECESGAILRQNGFFSTPPTPEADPQALLGWTRYEKARKLNPAQWAELHQRNLRGENFDNMIDALPATTQPVQQAAPTPAEPAQQDTKRTMRAPSRKWLERALDKPGEEMPLAGSAPAWRIEREPNNVLALHRLGTAQPHRFEPGDAVHSFLSDLIGGCPECGGRMEYEDGEPWSGPSVGCVECGAVATPPAEKQAAPSGEDNHG